MVTVILSHEVKDATEWKKVFDEGESLRAGAGVKTNGVYTAADNSNFVTVVAEFPSAEAVDGFVNNPQLQATMQQAGVIGKPDIKILNTLS